jgi:AmmeMemoRadiSam system protein B
MSYVRRAAVAGTWYPDEPALLIEELEACLAGVTPQLDPLDPPPRAIVVPHAGLKYSGPVAAFAYHAARVLRPSAVVLIGPSHFVPFDGVSIWPAGTWETPLGAVSVDEELARAIQTSSGEIAEVEVAHAREHSLEMQLPFLAHLMPGVPIVPMVMGHQTRATAFALSHAVAGAVHASGRDVLLVASSDLSHYEEATTAAHLDAMVVGYVEALDAAGLMDALDREPRHACGGGPIVSVLRAAALQGATQARVLRYADSGDVSGDKSSVVGYMAAAIW